MNLLQYTLGHPHTCAQTHTFAHSHPCIYWSPFPLHLLSVASQVLPWVSARPAITQAGPSGRACLSGEAGRLGERQEQGKKSRPKTMAVPRLSWPWVVLGIDADTMWPPARTCSLPRHSRPLCLFFSFSPQMVFPIQSSLLLSLAVGLPALAPPQLRALSAVSPGSPSSLLRTLTLRSSAETKLSEADNYSPAHLAFPPSPRSTATLASPRLSPAPRQ